MSLVVALSSIEFWFGVSVGIALNKTAREVLLERLFGSSTEKTSDD